MARSVEELEARINMLEAQQEELNLKLQAMGKGIECACPFAVEGVARCIHEASENVRQARATMDGLIKERKAISIELHDGRT